jgi:hypothetical protein
VDKRTAHQAALTNKPYKYDFTPGSGKRVEPWSSCPSSGQEFAEAKALIEDDPRELVAGVAMTGRIAMVGQGAVVRTSMGAL